MQNVLNNIPEDTSESIKMVEQKEYKETQPTTIFNIIDFNTWFQKNYKNIDGLRLVDIMIKDVENFNKKIFTLPHKNKRELYLLKNTDKIRIPDIKGNTIKFFNQEGQFSLFYNIINLNNRGYLFEFIKGHKLSFFNTEVNLNGFHTLPICKLITIKRKTKNIIFDPIDIQINEKMLDKEIEVDFKNFLKGKYELKELIKLWNLKKFKTNNYGRYIELINIGYEIFKLLKES